VAVDFCNGACMPVAERLLAALGCTLFPLNEEPSGEFAHPPAPSEANMRQLGTLMRCLRADVGAAINVDGDRVGFVQADGKPLSEEYSLPLAARNRLARRPGPVVSSFSTSRMVEAVAAHHDQPVLRTSVGEGHVVDHGLAEGAVLAGEGSGGVAVLPNTMTYDALQTLSLVLETMAPTGTGLHDLVADLPRYVMRKGEIVCPPDLCYKAMDGFRSRFTDGAVDFSDGVRVVWDDAWLHVRASNTEPLLRVIVEADEAPRADALFEDAMKYARRTAFGH
jgi:phosphomannomutase